MPLKCSCNLDTEPARQMVVAGAGERKRVQGRLADLSQYGSRRGHNLESFDGVSDGGSCDAVVLVTSLLGVCENA